MPHTSQTERKTRPGNTISQVGSCPLTEADGTRPACYYWGRRQLSWLRLGAAVLDQQFVSRGSLLLPDRFVDCAADAVPVGKVRASGLACCACPGCRRPAPRPMQGPRRGSAQGRGLLRERRLYQCQADLPVILGRVGLLNETPFRRSGLAWAMSQVCSKARQGLVMASGTDRRRGHYPDATTRRVCLRDLCRPPRQKGKGCPSFALHTNSLPPKRSSRRPLEPSEPSFPLIAARLLGCRPCLA